MPALNPKKRRMGSKIRKTYGITNPYSPPLNFSAWSKKEEGGEKMPPAYPDRPPHYKNPIDMIPDASRPPFWDQNSKTYGITIPYSPPWRATWVLGRANRVLGR